MVLEVNIRSGSGYGVYTEAAGTSTSSPSASSVIQHHSNSLSSLQPWPRRSTSLRGSRTNCRSASSR
jgi:hypothetical protein